MHNFSDYGIKEAQPFHVAFKFQNTAMEKTIQVIMNQFDADLFAVLD